MEKKKKVTEEKMIDDFMYVLENYPNADLSKEEDRQMVAEALSGIMCSHHIVSYISYFFTTYSSCFFI